MPNVAQEASQRLCDGDWEGLPITAEAKAVLVDYQQGISHAGVMPSPICISIEQHERLFILNYPGGSRLNRTIGMIIAAMLSAKSGYKVGYQFDPYRVILDVPARTTVKDMLAITKGFQSEIGSLLRFAIKDSPMFIEGIKTFVTPDSAAASIFAVTPPTGNTCPLTLNEPVRATV